MLDSLIKTLFFVLCFVKCVKNSKKWVILVFLFFKMDLFIPTRFNGKKTFIPLRYRNSKLPLFLFIVGLLHLLKVRKRLYTPHTRLARSKVLKLLNNSIFNNVERKTLFVQKTKYWFKNLLTLSHWTNDKVYHCPITINLKR